MTRELPSAIGNRCHVIGSGRERVVVPGNDARDATAKASTITLGGIKYHARNCRFDVVNGRQHQVIARPAPVSAAAAAEEEVETTPTGTPWAGVWMAAINNVTLGLYNPESTPATGSYARLFTLPYTDGGGNNVPNPEPLSTFYIIDVLAPNNIDDYEVLTVSGPRYLYETDTVGPVDFYEYEYILYDVTGLYYA